MEELLRERYEKWKNRQKRFVMEYDELRNCLDSENAKEKKLDFHFESQYNMEYATDVWCQQFENTRYDSVVFIYGIGHQMYLQKFIKTVDFELAVVFEPDIQRFAEFLCLDVEDVLSADNIYFIAGEKRHTLLRHILENSINYNNRLQIYIASIPNYIKCYESDYREYYKIMDTKFDSVVVVRNTNIAHEKQQSFNYLNNLFKLIEEAGIQELVSAIQLYNNYPAVLAAAGPSLDKNVKLLRKYKGKCFIVAVDAALNTLRKNEIVPDLIVTIDPKFEHINALDDEEFNNLPMIVNLISGYKLLESHTGRKFFDGECDKLAPLIAGRANKILPVLGTGGSVANSAFSFLEYAGFKKIILIGQDLAYPDNKAHSSDAFENEKDIDAEASKYYYVEDINGGRVLTEKNMDLYRLWYEETIREKSDLTVVDATEGGALIKGTEIITLQEALERYCILPEVDFVGAINKADNLFTPEVGDEIKKEIIELYTTTDKAISRLNNGRILYDELEAAYKDPIHNIKKINAIMEELDILGKFIDCEPQMALFGMYAAKERISVLDDMPPEDKEEMSAQIHMLAEAGRKMLDAYILAGEKIKQDWNRFMEEKHL